MSPLPAPESLNSKYEQKNAARPAYSNSRMCRGWMTRYPYFSSASRSQHVHISVSIAQRSVTAAVDDALCCITCRSADEVSGSFYVVLPALLFEMDAVEPLSNAATRRRKRARAASHIKRWLDSACHSHDPV
jgi:hypothetical protein